MIKFFPYFAGFVTLCSGLGFAFLLYYTDNSGNKRVK